ncbi:MAG: hypothetical protein HXS48_15395 [Theionarchaea archaeon]|nr:hypothetical protein [Theionarchaea archaeon]
MADVLLIGVREEDKADFMIELIKGLMSRGLTVSYAGAYYCESEDSFVYDNITNLLFFTSTYFREVQMKSKKFKNWESFLDDIDFEQIDERLIIYVSTCTRRIKLQDYFGNLENDFINFLQDCWKDFVVELIRNSFEMSFSTFESYYPEIVDILGVDRRILIESRARINNEEIKVKINEEGEDDIFGLFINNCVRIRKEIEESGAPTIDDLQKFRELEEEYKQLMKEKKLTKEDLVRLENVQKEYMKLESEIAEKGKPRDDSLNEIKRFQEKLETECSRDPSKSKLLIREFLSSPIIDRITRSRERIMFFDILGRAPKRKILCIYYEENGVEEKEINLYFYPERPTEGGNRGPIDEAPIPRSQMNGFGRPKDVYGSESIGRVVDEHVVPALHPSLIDIRFPVNGFMMEVDSEEPEIGFLGKRIIMNRYEKLYENLKISPDLEKMLYIYRLRGDDKEEVGKRFHRIRLNYITDRQKEDILILGRIEHLYKICIVNKFWRLIYQDTLFILRWLAILLPSLAIFLYLSFKYSFPFYKEFMPDILLAIGVLLGTAFAFWTLRTFALNYLLEPTHNMLKWGSYICLAAIILGRIEFFGAEFLIVFFVFLLLFAGILSAKYIRSAVLYELNESFKIIGYNDTVEIENPNDRNKVEIVNILKCGRFQTIIKKEEVTEVFLNSEFFPRIRHVRKKVRTLPREMAYSSGIYIYSKDQQKKDKLIEELTYKKPKTWGSWSFLKNILLDKGQIESRKNTDSEYSPSERLIYFGQWDNVMKKVAGSIPLFPQSVLFRSIIILAVVSVLIFNFLFSYKVLEINFVGIALFLVISSVSIFVAWKLKIRMWRVLLVLVLYLLLLVQLHNMILLTIFFLILFIYLFCLFGFLVKQMVYYLMIWAYEKCVGKMISIDEGQESEGNEENPLVMRGTEIKKNPLVTQLSMRLPTGLEEERIYLNKVFFCNILMSDEWYLKTDIGADSTLCKILFSKLKKMLQIRR